MKSIILIFWILILPFGNSVNITQLKNVIKPELEAIVNYTGNSCYKRGIFINSTTAMSKVDDCINEHLIPRLENKSDDFLTGVNSTVNALWNMSSFEDFLLIRDEIDDLCMIIPQASNCFLRGFMNPINTCWDELNQRIFGYVNIILPNFCHNYQIFKEHFLFHKNSECFSKYKDSFWSCFTESYAKYRTSCGIIPCFQRSVLPCDDVKLDRNLRKFFNHMQEETNCNKVMEVYDEPATILPPQFTTQEPDLNDAAVNVNYDNCDLLRDKMDALLKEGIEEPSKFPNHFLNLCDEYNKNEICLEYFQNKDYLISIAFLIHQCNRTSTYDMQDVLFESSECIFSTLRKDLPCGISNSKTIITSPSAPSPLNDCILLLDNLRNIDFFGNILIGCNRVATAAAHESESYSGMNDSLWGIIAVPIFIIIVGIIIYRLKQKKKVRNYNDSNSNSSLLEVIPKNHSNA